MAWGPRPRDGGEGLLGEQRLRFVHEFHEAEAIGDRPTSVAPLQAIDVPAAGDVMWFAGSRSVPTNR